MTEMTVSEVEVASAAALRHAVQRLSKRLRKQAQYGLSASRVSVLRTVERHGPLRMTELAQREQVGKSTLTRFAARLETEGYLAREVDPDDGRGFLVSLTAQGAAVLEASSERQDSYLARQLAALDKEDRQLLERVAPVIERLLDLRA